VLRESPPPLNKKNPPKKGGVSPEKKRAPLPHKKEFFVGAPLYKRPPSRKNILGRHPTAGFFIHRGV